MNKYQEQDGATAKQCLLFKRKKRELPDAERVLTLQRNLYRRAKQSRKNKFYVLYDKVFLLYILREAWFRVRRNNGSAGVDGMRIEDVELYGVDRYLEELREDLRQQTYRPEAVKRKLIAKANGKTRPLCIPTVRDRIAQTACLLILEPIFEADFDESSNGAAKERSER
ncbi:hypothetical protein K4L44_08140 [Halosquirtibacter laminarini]|uniref:Uncharacterized protein n=1 Tax=Halosquirtibacter laminarini TaxID=3374600 RepID=A0AC61NJS0_9BACT|nr:hypothetical protein K4L44_08140 [Prolixibacteraceae bacterium]